MESYAEERELDLPPQSKQAEEAVLGSILKSPPSIAAVADVLRPDDFYTTENGMVFGAMLSLRGDGVPIDYHTVADRLTQRGQYERVGGLLYLAGINLSTPTATFIEHYGRIVERTSIMRQLISSGQSIAALAYRDNLEPDAAIDKASEIVDRVARRRGGPRAQFPFVFPAHLPEPSPRAFRVDPLVPEGAVTVLYGDAGLGKSFIALALAIAIAAGMPRFAAMPLIGGRVLYVDAELDDEEFTRRAYRLSRGLGLSAPPADLVYLNLEQSLASSRGRAWLEEAIGVARADFTILDSLSFASAGAKLNDPGEMAAVLMGLRGVGTLLALDHSNWAGVQGNQSESHPMGSFFKRAFSRSMIQIDRALGGGITLRANKATFGEIPEPIHLALTHRTDRIEVQRIDLQDGRMAGADQNMPAIERVALHLLVQGPSRPDGMLESTQLRLGTVKNCLTRLRIDGRAEGIGDGVWRHIPREERETADDNSMTTSMTTANGVHTSPSEACHRVILLKGNDEMTSRDVSLGDADPARPSSDQMTTDDKRNDAESDALPW